MWQNWQVCVVPDQGFVASTLTSLYFSGKSSVVSAILRILELDSGTILIDDIDISKVSRSHVRSRINTIPQQPFFLHGTVRLNANPEGNATDEAIVESLQAVNLWSHIQLKGGLDIDMSDDLLSHGQQQLFCLARALCKSSNIIIMDEATSRYVEKQRIYGLLLRDLSVWTRKQMRSCKQSFGRTSKIKPSSLLCTNCMQSWTLTKLLSWKAGKLWNSILPRRFCQKRDRHLEI
jgi:ABC-type iron transport system FetAB ATPase subunit